MSSQRYLLKIETVKQVTERGHRAADVTKRIGVSGHNLYQSPPGHLLKHLPIKGSKGLQDL